MTSPGLFDPPPDPARLIEQERARLIAREKELLREHGADVHRPHPQIHQELTVVRKRLTELRSAFPPPAPRPRVKRVRRDGRMAAAGERD